MDILTYIPTGSRNAVTRAELVIMTGLPDRQIRRAIHEARRETPILNMSDGTGYFVPDDSDQDRKLLKDYYHQEQARLKSIGWALMGARRALREAENANTV